MRIPQTQGDFEGFIISYSSSISFSARLAFDLRGVMRLAPSLWGTAPSSSSILRSTKIQQPITALCYEKMAAFRFKTAPSNSNSPSHILPLKCSIFGKTGLSESSLFDEGRFGTFEHLDKRHLFQVSLKIFYLTISIL